MTSKSGWENMLDRRAHEFVGGEFELIKHPEGMFRGPIASITIVVEKLVIITKWTAHFTPLEEWLWQEVPDKRFEYSLRGEEVASAPSNAGRGQLHFTYPFCNITLIPKGGRHRQLSYNEVNGL